MFGCFTEKHRIFMVRCSLVRERKRDDLKLSKEFNMRLNLMLEFL
jgi:hypothetical protein